MSKLTAAYNKTRECVVTRSKIMMGYPEARYPTIPKILKKTADFQKLEGSKDRIAFTLSQEPIADKKCTEMIKNVLLEQFQDTDIPANYIAVSMALPNFKIGQNCHDFQPLDWYKNIKGYFTYKKITEQVQAAYFNDEAGNQFLAGVCYYATPAGKWVAKLQTEQTLLRFEFQKAEPFPLNSKSRFDTKAFKKFARYGRYCETEGCRVLVWVGKADGQIVHLNYHPVYCMQWTKGCAECAKDHFEYMWIAPEGMLNRITVVKNLVNGSISFGGLLSYKICVLCFSLVL